MTTPPVPPHKMHYHQLLIGFNHHLECRNVLAFAAQVAQVAQVDLAGVFVEDQELLDLARLPFSSEILSASGQTRNLDIHRVESDLRAIALGMQEALRKLAEQARRRYSFRTVRGHLLRELIAQADAGDLILLRTGNDAWRRTRPGAAALRGPVVLLQTQAGENGNLLGLAREIASSLNLDMTIQKNYSGPEMLRTLNAGLIIAPASLFSAPGEDIDRFAEAACAPVLMVPV